MNEACRKKNKSGFRVYVTTSVDNSIFCQIETLAYIHGITKAEVLRNLLVRGLEAYEHDCLFTGVADSEKEADRSFVQEGPADLVA